MRKIAKGWTQEDITRLIKLADDGATLMRASAALGRRSTSLQKKARELGKPFAGVRRVREELRASGALDPASR